MVSTHRRNTAISRPEVSESTNKNYNRPQNIYLYGLRTKKKIERSYGTRRKGENFYEEDQKSDKEAWQKEIAAVTTGGSSMAWGAGTIAATEGGASTAKAAVGWQKLSRYVNMALIRYSWVIGLSWIATGLSCSGTKVKLLSVSS